LFLKFLFIWEYLCICTDGFKDWPWRSESLRKHKTLIITRLVIEFGCSESFMTSNGLKSLYVSPVKGTNTKIIINHQHDSSSGVYYGGFDCKYASFRESSAFTVNYEYFSVGPWTILNCQNCIKTSII